VNDARAVPLAVLAAVLLLGCGASDQWSEARALYETHRNRNARAYDAWTALDPGTPEGQEAHRRLLDAERLYRQGIEAVDSGEPEAEVNFVQAVVLAPIDPALWLPLARAYRRRSSIEPDNPLLFLRAVEYYQRYLALLPTSDEAEAARAELVELDPEGGFGIDPLFVTPAPPDTEGELQLTMASALAGSAFVLALLAMGLLLLRRERSGLTLAELASARPELHPAIAYLIGSLRHELLKHRIGAVASGVADLTSGRASTPAQRFVTERLFGGEPLAEAWEGHLLAFERALGPELDLRRRDVAFRRAAKAIDTLVRLQPELAKGAGHARLQAAHRELRAFDGALGQALSRLTRTRVDELLLRDVVGAVRQEIAAGKVALDGIALEAPTPGPYIEVFRGDLTLVLKNVVRNAILAVARDDAPRRVRIEVITELEATGEEQVLIRVLDTAAARPDLDAAKAKGMDRGLGLVSAALQRYHGALSVEDAERPYEKAVVVRFFRAFD